ncbi:hypothetical protein [Rubripirellula lacrimiformis]|uniref:hypothetical protein n=1 Tax=Rubripirellula lacrimiformis TaxID=1930273 RepID=UPI001C54E8A7|nr:hypothetical protein [Rubripirellula lacrimiformis]
MSFDYLDPFDPSSDSLLHLAFRHVDDSMLREIAAADYGEDAGKHLSQLLAIKNGTIPAPMQWEPKEVLELIRWSEPEDPTWSPGSTGHRGHWMRLLSCAVLLRAEAEPANEGRFTGEDSTVIQLVDSAIKLGDAATNAALQFLCWCTQSSGFGDWDRPYFTVAIQILLVWLDKCDPDTAVQLIAASDYEHSSHAEMFKYCQKTPAWKKFIEDVLVGSTNAPPEVKRFGENLANAILAN